MSKKRRLDRFRADVICLIHGDLSLEACQVEGERDDEPTHLTTDGDVSPPRVALSLCGRRINECGWGEALAISQILGYGLCLECARNAESLIRVMDDRPDAKLPSDWKPGD